MNLELSRHATCPKNDAGARNIIIGVLNAISSVNEAAETHLSIEDERLHVLTVSDTRIPLEATTP